MRLPTLLFAVSVFSLAMSGAPGAQAPTAGAGLTAPQASSAPGALVLRHPEAGGLLVRQYPPETYDGGAQNWSLLQDARGVIYVGSTNALLEYDGVTWRRIITPTRTTIRSLAADASGRIWVGAVGDLGYIEPDKDGQTQFVSLIDKLPADVRVFEDVWRLYTAPDGVYFQTQIGIFRWANDAFTVWKPTARIFNRAQFANNTLYVGQPGLALMALRGDTLQPVPGAERMGDEIYPIVLPYDDTHLLMGTRTNGLFLYDGQVMRPFATEADALIKANLYRGFVLPNGALAFTTTNVGVVLMDRQGRLLEHIDQRSGLPTDQIYYAMPDREGGLWLGLSVGLARVEAQSPFSLFGRDEGLRAASSDLIRHDGRLYIAHGQGVQYLNPRRGGLPELPSVTGLVNQCWELKEFVDPDGKVPPQLLVTASDGLFLIEGAAARAIVPSPDRSFGTFVLEQSRIDPHRMWVGLADGLASVRWSNARWINEGRVPGITEQVRSLKQASDGTLWAGTQSSGLLMVRSADAPAGSARPERPVIERYGAEQGLAAGFATVRSVAGRFYVSVLGKIAVLDASGRFVEDKTFEVVERDPESRFINFKEGPDGRIYVASARGAAVLTRRPDGTYITDRQLLSRFSAERTGAFFPETDGVVWFSAGGRLVRFDTRLFSRSSPAYAALIRRITVNQADALSPVSSPGEPPALDAATRSMRFEFAAPSFVNERTTQYQARLDGVDADWSVWSTESRRDYTNLSLGDYRFHVRARNELSQVSDEGAYAFTILPPWYRTWWANAAYLLGFIGLVFGAARTQRHRVVGKERQRSEFAEARLRAESAEALARSESDGKKNIELLSDIGREITASLDFDTIFGKLYERVNQLADADVFGVGLYHPERQEIEYRLAIEQGKRYAPYSRSTADPDQLPVWCITHRQPVFINDVHREFAKYVSRFDEQSRPLEDGSMSKAPQSIIYLPLEAKDRVLGLITIQSFEQGAYTEQHVSMMRSLASYTAIALDNAAAYRQLNEQEHENRRLFEEAQRARAVAEEADAAKSAFLSTVSHELRTPLTSVLGFAKIIKKRLDDRIFPLVPRDDKKVVQTIQQVEDNLKVVVSEGERLTKLIDDVLDLAKIEAGKLEWHMEPVSLGEVIDRATAATASLFEQKGLRLVTDVAPGLPTVTGDSDRLIQVVINLISNAVKFTGTGSVTCRAARRGGEIVVSVVDTGMGIAPADQPKVFERFKQVGDTLTDKPKGTGLGLPICREIVEHHGGRVWVESELGHGSTFSFSVPLPDAQVTTAGTGGTPMELAALIRQLRDQVVVTTPRTAERAPRLLVVDDDPNIRELLTQELTEAGYVVRVATNGREAIADVRRERPDLVVLDVMMPEMNGFDVAAVLKNDPLTMDIPIVILSIVQDRERGIRIGVDRYLTKPIDTDLLFREVGALIEQRKSHRHVLVVDEDASTVKTLADVLTSRGYSVSDARDADLVEKARALKPDIILLNSVLSAQSDNVRMLRFEKGMDHVLFLVYQ